MREADAATAERRAAEDDAAAFRARAAWFLQAMVEADAALAEPDAELDHERAVMAVAMAAEASGELG
jgi:hypothetical protein